MFVNPAVKCAVNPAVDPVGESGLSILLVNPACELCLRILLVNDACEPPSESVALQWCMLGNHACESCL